MPPKFLAGLGAPLDAAINLEVAEEELLHRLAGRGRADDNARTIRNRLQVFASSTRNHPRTALQGGVLRPPFPQVAPGRRDQSYAFNWPTGMRSLVHDGARRDGLPTSLSWLATGQVGHAWGRPWEREGCVH